MLPFFVKYKVSQSALLYTFAHFTLDNYFLLLMNVSACQDYKGLKGQVLLHYNHIKASFVSV